jgi:hypothetical protein
MRQAYRLLANLIALLVLVQLAAIGLAWFTTINEVDDGTGKVFTGAEDDYNVGHLIHSLGAVAIALVALILMIVSFFAKVDGGVKWAGFVLLAVVLQWVLAIVAFEVPVVGALHALNAMAVAGLASVAARRTLAAPKQEPVSA